MHVPSWLGAFHRGASQVTISDAPIYVPDPERPVGWRYLGMFYSAIPDPELCVDPAIVAAVRENHDPYFVPLVAKWVFQPPLDQEGSEKMLVFKRHALASYIPSPRTHKELFYVEMPTNATFHPPNQLNEILMVDWNPETFSTIRDKSITLPGEYLPFTWEVFHNPRVHLSPKELKRRFIDAPIERIQREREKMLAERERQDKEAQKFINRRIEKMSDREIKQFQLALREVLRRRYRERRNAPVHFAV